MKITELDRIVKTLTKKDSHGDSWLSAGLLFVLMIGMVIAMNQAHIMGIF